MKVAIFAVQYKASDYNNSYYNPIPIEFNSDTRGILFDGLVKRARDNSADLAVLPGGFFRASSPGGIANALKHYPSKITVLVGCDNVSGSQSEVWVINPRGRIIKKIPEAWKRPGKFSQKVLDATADRRFPVYNKKYAAFSCGDILIDNEQNAGRKPPIFDSKAAFVLAHYSSSGRSFTPAMRRLKIPIFLSHHVKWPHSTKYFAYDGRKSLKPIKEFWNKESEGLEWIGRVYKV